MSEYIYRISAIVMNRIILTINKSVKDCLFFFLLTIINIGNAASQASSDNHDINIGINKWDPVHVKVDERKVTERNNTIKFLSTNSTYYIFKLLVDFEIFENLVPPPPKREIEITHGTNVLFSVNPHIPDKGYNYRYTYKYRLKSSDNQIDSQFPYLIPLSDGKIALSKKTASGKLTDSFTGAKGDTVFAMRRGLVTSVPRIDNLDFRISGHSCLEIMHQDGTFMIYNNLINVEDFTSPGKIILSGQPVGLISDSTYIFVNLLKVSDKSNILISLPVSYAVGESETAYFSNIDGTKAIHFRSVIEKELNARDLKKKSRK